MVERPAKDRVLEAAILLFYQKGFDGTTVRDIAKQASVNVSLISYYFEGKQGLLEFVITRYYEAYLKLLEQSLREMKGASPLKQFKKAIQTTLHFKQRHYQLSCFIHRELSLDSVFVREMTMTYLAKENHCLQYLLDQIIPSHHQRNRHLLLIQLKGILAAPYLMHHEWRHQVIGETAHRYFINEYVKIIDNWMKYICYEGSPPLTKIDAHS